MNTPALDSVIACRHPAHGPRKFLPRICRRPPRSAFPIWAIPEMTTQPAQRVTMDDAISMEAVTEFIDEVLAGSGWQIGRVKRRSSRLAPPDYWTLFEVSINKDEATRSLRMVAAGAFDDAAWQKLERRLERSGAGRA